ncbi:MAG: family 16 glycosylhydrolase [Planctomycetota bacterium]
MNKTLFLALAACMFTACSGFAQTSPQFNPGQDPRPKGQRWELVPELSDEFDGKSLDNSKWMNTDPSRWIGRPPGIFKQDTVSVTGGLLRITNYLLDSPEVQNGNLYTHAGGHLISRTPAQVGYYCEARIKANKTFMSSTFWLITYRNEQTGCDVRTTELDIQECVGQVTSSAGWAQDFDESMHSNTHSRNVTCDTPQGSRGNDTLTSTKVYDDFHTYAAWWKSPTEILFFLDGQFVYSVTPVADFDIEMYMKLVTETYDWNPVPADNGMNGTEEERTTSYDWVRTWQLADARFARREWLPPRGITEDVVSFNPPLTLSSQLNYTVTVDYTATEPRDIVLEFWNGNSWLDSATGTVNRGIGSVDLTVDLNSLPAPGSNYLWKASIRPVGASWQENIDLVQVGNVTITP